MESNWKEGGMSVGTCTCERADDGGGGESEQYESEQCDDKIICRSN
jgi:hypothetical protein